jgi:phenylacetate-CoA ligase
MFTERGVDCGAENIVAELAKCPPLDKQTVREHLEELISDEFRGRKNLIAKTTGGSTGVPLTIYGDLEDYRVNNIVIARQRRWVGWVQGMETLTLFGGFRDRKSLRRLRLKQFLLNDRTINIMDSGSLDYVGILERLRRRVPEVLVGYFGVLKHLASLALSEDKPVHGIRVIMACAEPIDEQGRVLVQRGLGADMISQYGSREIGALAQECRRRDGYHCPQDVAFFETLDSRGAPALQGNLTVTYFANRVVPLIRYSTGDAASIDPSPCACGLPYVRVRNLEGRIASLILMADGKSMTSLLLPHILKDYDWIEEYQAEQPVRGKLIIRIRRNDARFSQESLVRLKEKFGQLAGPGLEVQWRFGEPFLQVPAGKHVCFISTMLPNEK